MVVRDRREIWRATPSSCVKRVYGEGDGRLGRLACNVRAERICCWVLLRTGRMVRPDILIAVPAAVGSADAVGFHGHPRATADIDIWVPMREDTAEQLVSVLRAFGFDVPQLSTELFLSPDRVIRLGAPPLRIELLTTIAGVEFDACYARAVHTTLGDVDVRIIALDDLKTNKRAAGRHQDLADLDHLP
jgi:hypothetical protein